MDSERKSRNAFGKLWSILKGKPTVGTPVPDQAAKPKPVSSWIGKQFRRNKAVGDKRGEYNIDTFEELWNSMSPHPLPEVPEEAKEDLPEPSPSESLRLLTFFSEMAKLEAEPVVHVPVAAPAQKDALRKPRTIFTDKERSAAEKLLAAASPLAKARSFFERTAVAPPKPPRKDPEAERTEQKSRVKLPRSRVGGSPFQNTARPARPTESAKDPKLGGSAKGFTPPQTPQTISYHRQITIEETIVDCGCMGGQGKDTRT